MKILGEKFQPDEFEEHVARYNFGVYPANKLVVHHTWRPEKDQWDGAQTLKNIKTYYEGKGWYAGPHLFIAEDGIWTFTPMRENGIHASKLNYRSIGIEVVGNYDVVKWSGKTKTNALKAIKILMEKLELSTEDLYFHRDVTSKSCPGHAISKEWIIKELVLLDVENKVEPSPWAEEGWDWQKSLALDLSVHPQQKVDAEWVFAILKKLKNMEDHS